MNNFIDQFKKRQREVFRTAVYIAGILLVTYRFPDSGSVRKDFEKGATWNYEDLVAPFEFPVQKSPEEMNAEFEQKTRDFIPFYAYVAQTDTVVFKTVKDSFPPYVKKLTDLKPGPDRAQDSFRLMTSALQITGELLDNGIIAIDDEHSTKAGSSPLQLLKGQEVYPRTFADFYSSDYLKPVVRDVAISSGIAKPDAFASYLSVLIEPNIVFDTAHTNQALRDLFDEIHPTKGIVEKGKLIIARGEMITDETYQMIESFYQEEKRIYGDRNKFLVMAGNLTLTSLLFFIFASFLKIFSPRVFLSPRKMVFILLLVVSFVYIAGWAVDVQIPSYYVIPYCIVPIILRTFFGTRLALYTHLMIVLLASFIVPLGIEYPCLNIMAGMVAILTNVRAHYWSQFFVSITLIFMTYLIGFLSINIIREGNLFLHWMDILWLGGNVFFTLLAYPLIPIFEKLFGYTSDISLMELSDTNKPLLKKLQIEATGTFQHSLQVSNLAEAAAHAVGANALLVKVGSLYHDIGKMKNPRYFIENQVTGKNPHDELSYEESARIIIEHVSYGVEMANKHKLPDSIVDFIRTHHGNLRVEYFYRSFIKSIPEKLIDETKFRYPGPLPYSRETAIVMMADSVEAASRSLKVHDQKSIDNLVEALIEHKIDNKQFVNSDITFKDITTIKKILKKMLNSIYHVRIEYPQE